MTNLFDGIQPGPGSTISAEDLERLKRGLPIQGSTQSMQNMPNAPMSPGNLESLKNGMPMQGGTEGLMTPMSAPSGGQNLLPNMMDLNAIGGPPAYDTPHGMMAPQNNGMQAPPPQPNNGMQAPPPQPNNGMQAPPMPGSYGGLNSPVVNTDPGALQSGYDQALEEAHLKKIFEQEGSDKRVQMGMKYRDRGLSALKDYKDMSGHANIGSLMNMAKASGGNQQKFENFMPPLNIPGMMGR